MNKLFITLMLLLTSLSMSAQVTATFEYEPGTEFETLPDLMLFSLSEAMFGDPPTVYIKGPTQEKKLLCTRPDPSDYQNYQIWVAYYVKGELLEEIKEAGEFSIVVTLMDGTELEPFVYKLKKPVTVTFEIEPGTEFETLPDLMLFSLSEAMFGDPPTVYIKGPTQEKKLLCTRPDPSDYQNYQIWVAYYVKGELLEEIKEAGEFSIVVTLMDGTELEPFVYKLKKPVTVTFEIEPGTEFETLPDLMLFSLSEAMFGNPPTVYIKGPTQEKKLLCTRPDPSDYQNYQIWVAYYVKGELLEEIKEAGEFSIVVTLMDGTELPPYIYKLKPASVPYEAVFAEIEGSVFAGLPDEICFTLNQKVTGELPRVIVNGEIEIASYGRDESGQEFYIRAAEDIPAEAYADGKVQLEVVVPETEETAGSAMYYVVASDLSWTPAAGCEEGRVFSSLPAALSYELSAALPAEGCLSGGMVLRQGDEEIEIAVPFSIIDGTEVVYDLSMLGGDEIQKIVDNGDFSMILQLSNKSLATSYRLDIRMQAITLGYCTDEFGADMTSFGTEGAATTVGAAIKIPAARLESLAGGKITGLRIGMDEGLERVYAWIRPDLSSPAIVMKMVENIESGWNEVVFDEPYAITGDEIYVGYSGYQPAGVKAIRCGGIASPDGCWLGIKDVWEDFSDKGYGSLYIQAVGEAILPSVDLGVDNLVVDKEFYKSSDSLTARFSVMNTGADEVGGYVVNWRIDDDGLSGTIEGAPLASDSRMDHDIELSLTGLTDGIHTLTVECVVTDAGKDDQVETNNSVSVPVSVYSTDYPRTVLLEQFTTINCVNCPAGTAALKVAAAERDDVAWIAHHVGFGVDVFTLDESKLLLDYGVVGAPSLMIDRSVVNGSVPPVTIGYSNAEIGGEIIGRYIDQCAEVPAFASLDMSHVYDSSSRRLEIIVDGECNAIFGRFYPQSNLTLYLTEDNLTANTPQAGADINYVHDHVLRQVLTPAEGIGVEWNENRFSATFDTVIDETMSVGDMKIVAVLHQPFDASDVTHCSVLNAAVSTIDVRFDGVDLMEMRKQLYIDADGSICGDGLKSIEVYTISGLRIANTALPTGLYIVKVVGEDGECHTIKFQII